MFDKIKNKLRRDSGMSRDLAAYEREATIQRIARIEIDRAEQEKERSKIVAEQQRRNAEQQRLKYAEQQRFHEEHLERMNRERILRDQERAQNERARHADKGKIRELREFIREKHRLDVDIWQQGRWLQGNAHSIEREEIEELCERSDALMSWILVTVEKWDESHFKDGIEGEWKMAKHIKTQMMKKKHRTWAEKLPWQYGRTENVPRHMYSSSSGTL